MLRILKRTLKVIWRYMFCKKSGILIYAGMHKGGSFDNIFFNYKKCYGFEANPVLFQFLKKKYRFFKNVEIIHGALCNQGGGTVSFNISNNNYSSSSLGEIRKESVPSHIKIKNSVKVPAINLMDFLKQRKINFIDSYISDVQGMDLTVLKTIKPFIDEKKLKLSLVKYLKISTEILIKIYQITAKQGFVIY